MTILQKAWILPIGGVALGRVCACSLRSKLVVSVLKFQHVKRHLKTLNVRDFSRFRSGTYA